jgi:hypothetical protein
MRVDPNDEHMSSSNQKWVAAAGTPDAGCRSCFEPRHSTGTGGQTHRSKANPNGGKAFSRPPAGTLDATKPPQRVTRTQPSGQYASVTARRHRVIVAVAAFVVLACGCSNGHGSTAVPASTMALPPAGNSTASLVATARAWANAFLVGSLGDIKALQGPECADHSGTTFATRTVTLYLKSERAVMQKYFGRPLDKIKIGRVVVRNVTSTGGEALVEYDLPAAVVGNDNWVSYTMHDGRWKVSDCHAPIGGSSSSASGTVTVPAP